MELYWLCLFTATVHYLIVRLNELDQRVSSLFRWPILKKKKNDPQGKHSIQNQFSVKDALAEQWHPQNWNLFDYEDTWCMFDVHMVPGDSCCILREDVHLQVIRTVVLCSPTHACLNVTWLHDRTGRPYWYCHWWQQHWQTNALAGKQLVLTESGKQEP